MRHPLGTKFAKISFFLLDHKYDRNRRRQWQPTPVLLPGESHGRRSLVGCSPWGHKELGTTERLHFHFSLSCIGEGNGNLLQCSCLENPRDRGAWWAAVYGVTQSQTWLKRLSSSSSSMIETHYFFFLSYKWISQVYIRVFRWHNQMLIYEVKKFCGNSLKHIIKKIFLNLSLYFTLSVVRSTFSSMVSFNPFNSLLSYINISML